jgi:hypothetical protein
MWAAHDLRLSELRKDPGLLRHPNQLQQEDKFYLNVGEIFHPKSSRRCSNRVRES